MAMKPWTSVSELTTSRSVVHKTTTALANGDYTESLPVGHLREMWAQFTGTAGAGLSVTVYGTSVLADRNTDPATGSWVILKDNLDNNITKTSVPSADIIVDAPSLIAIKVTAGDGTTSITPHITAKQD